MAKRPADDSEHAADSLKGGERPIKPANGEDVDFEDEFEDEYESEDEIYEAGVDGRPDDEREAEERKSMWFRHKHQSVNHTLVLTYCRCYGCGSADLHTRAQPIGERPNTLARCICLRHVAHAHHDLAMPVL